MLGSDATANTPVSRLLAAHIPLSLLMDLASPTGPASGEIFTMEGAPEQPWW
ncbi:MAG: hypothetical protein ACRCTR_01930 [Actinomycetota bacterium]